MENPDSYEVAPGDERPARRDGTCFYCNQKIGFTHEEGCVCRSRSVVIRFSIEIVMEQPEDHDEEMLNFRYNDGTWCADNLIQDMEALRDRGVCLCPFVSAEYIREATKEDHEAQNFQFTHPDNERCE